MPIPHSWSTHQRRHAQGFIPSLGTRDEAERFRIAAINDRLAGRWMIGLLLGLRQGEVLGLTWDDVDLRARTLTVSHALQKIDNRFQLVAPKTKRSVRVLPIPTVVAHALERRHREQLAENAAVHLWQGNPLDLVFTTQIGTPIERSNDYRAFQALLKNTGLRKIRLHDLRHTTASLMLERRGIPARVVMELLGHSQISPDARHVHPRRQTAAHPGLIERLTGGD